MTGAGTWFAEIPFCLSYEKCNCSFLNAVFHFTSAGVTMQFMKLRKCHAI